MMRKRVLLLIVAALLLACVLGAFCACESYKTDPLATGGNKDAVVQSNGGLVVRQGDYLYFVNGYTGYLTEHGSDNWFGNVRKGAIVRVSYHNGDLGDDYVVVVPKSVMADSASVGFSIFGDWIYYVTPGSEEDRSGKVNTDELEFLRTRLDGTETQKILILEDTSVSYNYTSSALVYLDSSDNKLYSKDLSAKSFKEKDKGKCLAEEVTSVQFIKNETYDPSVSEISIADYVLYTKNAAEAHEKWNILYAVDPLGNAMPKILIGPDSYQPAKYYVKLLATSFTNGKLAIYYTKADSSSSEKTYGTFAYQFENKDLNFSKAGEVALSAKELSNLFPLGYSEGVVKTGSNSVIYYTDGKAAKGYGELNLATLLLVENDNFYYLNSDGVLLYYPLDGNSNAQFAYTTGEKMMTSFTGVEFYDGYFYFILDDDYDYMARVKLSEIDVYSGKDAAVTRVCYPTDEDKAAMEAEENADEDEE